MKKKNIFPILLLLQLNLLAQDVVMNGYVYDSETNEAIIGANIFTEDTKIGTVTNAYGYYSVILKKDRYVVYGSYLGYSPKELIVNLTKDTTINIYLHVTNKQLEEVVISAKLNESKSNGYSSIEFTPTTVSRLPSIFGENDPVKAVQTQLGVKTIGDGTSGYYVQGGNIDQNLVLIDEAPVYNPSHLFGLISVFNPDAVKRIDFYKGNITAKYGGRLSSVMDVKMNEGNMRKLQLSGGVSLLAARLSMQAPIVKNKASFLLSLRRSFIDIFVQPDEDKTVIPQFYDVNLKTNYKLDQNNRIFLSFYKGNDKILSVGDFYNSWGNQTTTIRYNHLFSSRVFSNMSLIHSDYRNRLEFRELENNISWTTAIKDITFKTDFSFFANSNNKIEFGSNTVYHNYMPGTAGSDFLESIPKSQAFENSIYLLNDINISQKIGVNYGIRYTIFQNIGSAIWYDYDKNNTPLRENINVHGTYNTYKNFQPRIAAKYHIDEYSTVKLAYSKTVQYIQLLQNNAYSYTSLETWIPASPNVLPQIADIFSVGGRLTKNKGINMTLNFYYKVLKNQIDFVDHARLLGTKYIETQIKTGKTTAYGAEINLQKTKGKLTGNVSYNYSKVIRDIAGINSDKSYPASYDMPNDARISVNYKLSERVSISGFWIYTSGRAYTMPSGYFEHEGFYVPLYSDRNKERMPNYHRMDIAVNINPKEYRKIKNYWKIGIYNIYARQNPLGYKFEYDSQRDKLRVYQFNFITIMPSISYSFKY